MINSTIDPVFWFRDKKKAATVCPHEKVRLCYLPAWMLLFLQWGEQQWLLAVPYDGSSLHGVSLRKLQFAVRGAQVFFSRPHGIEKKITEAWQRRQTSSSSGAERGSFSTNHALFSVNSWGLMRVASHFPNSVFFWMSKGPGKHWTYRDCTFSQFVWEMEHPKTIHFTKASEITIFK